LASENILPLASIVEKLDLQRHTGKQVVFTNGCFDILHAGHVQYLVAAKAEGDVLVVGVNSDSSMKIIKGEKRPIIPEDQRASVVAALDCVDFVTLFDEPDPYNVIKTLLPHVLVKGEDWEASDIIGADIVKSNGGNVVRIPVLPDISTSTIIERILKRYR